MEARTLRQIRGAKELLEDTVEAAAVAINEAQRKITRKPYALLARFDPIAAPVRRIEAAHLKITDGVYLAIRIGNRLTGLMAGMVLDQAEARAKGKSPSL